ncbi:MAG: GAF domain-containing protein [bacterium]
MLFFIPRLVDLCEQNKVKKRVREGVGELGDILYRLNPLLQEMLGEVSSIVALDSPEKENRRFLIVCARFFKSLGEKERPVILFIDDLHWADEGTLTILNELIRDITSYPLFILGTYRDNELGEGRRLSKIIGDAKKNRLPLAEIQMNNFTPSETNNFIGNLLLERTERTRELSNYIYKKSMGNPFFTIEILRQIVNEEGIRYKNDHWGTDQKNLESISIPATIIEVLLKRIDSLGKDTMNILSTAAVIGKRFKIEFLQTITQINMEELIQLVDEAMEMQLLERDNLRGELFFIHDRIREAFYQKISEEEKSTLHLRLGQALEEMYKDSKEIDKIIFELANHYLEGRDEEKSLKYGILAGKTAKARYANQEAIDFYLKVKALLEKKQMTSTPEYLEVLEDLGDVYRLAGNFLEAIKVLDNCKDLIPKKDKFKMAELYYKIGLTFWVAGKLEDSIYVMERCLYSLGVKMPEGKFQVILKTSRELVVQTLHTLFPRYFVKKEYSDDPLQTLIVKLLITLGHIYYFMDMKKCFYIYLRMLNLAEKIGPSYEMAYIYNTGGPVWIKLPWFSRAIRDLANGLNLSKKINNKFLEGVSYAYGCCTFYANNEIKEAIDYGYKGIEILKSIGDYFGLSVAYAFYINSNILAGEFKVADQSVTEFINLMKQVNSLQYLGWAYGWKVRLYCFIGTIDDEVINESKLSVELARRTNDTANFVWSREVLAFVYLIKREYNKAIKIIEEAAKLFSTHFNRCFWNLEIFPIGAQIYTSTITNTPDLSNELRDRYLERAKWFSKKSLGWGKKYRYFLGWAYQVNGTYNWLAGRKEQAKEIWEQGIKWLRENTQDKYRLGYILLEEASFLLEDKPDDRETIDHYKDYLVEARDLFTECGAEIDLKRANILLMSIDPKLVKGKENEWTIQRKLERSLQMSSFLALDEELDELINLDDILEKTMDTIIEIGGAERGALLLYPEEGGKEKGLEVKISYNLNKAQHRTEEFEISRSIIKKVAETRQALLVTDAEADRALRENLSVVKYGLQSVMCVPIIIEEKMIGCIYLENRLISGLFTEDKLNLISILSRRIGDAIINDRKGEYDIYFGKMSSS